MRRVATEYPHTEKFLRHAAAGSGTRAVTQATHEEVDGGAEIEFSVGDTASPRSEMETVRIRIDAVVAGELAVNRACDDRPFEGTVVASSHNGIKENDGVIGLLSRNCEVLLVDAANRQDMHYALRTYSSERYRKHIRV